jgi:hypothetical protein
MNSSNPATTIAALMRITLPSNDAGLASTLQTDVSSTSAAAVD